MPIDFASTFHRYLPGKGHIFYLVQLEILRLEAFLNNPTSESQPGSVKKPEKSPLEERYKWNLEMSIYTYIYLYLTLGHNSRRKQKWWLWSTAQNISSMSLWCETFILSVNTWSYPVSEKHTWSLRLRVFWALFCLICWRGWKVLSASVSAVRVPGEGGLI